MKPLFIMGALGAALLILGCESTPLARSDHPSRIALVMQDGVAPPVNDWDLQLSLGVIAGEFTGVALPAPKFFIPVSFSRDFSIPLAAVQRAFSANAQVLRSAAGTASPTVVPAQTRLLRLSAHIVDKNTGKTVMGGGFGEKTGTHAMMVYFDRACRYRQQVMEGEDWVDVAVDIPAAGIYWIRSDEISPNSFQLRTVTFAMSLQFVAFRIDR